MQKSFCFSVFTFYLLPFAFCLSFSIASCKLNPNKQTPGESYLQGEWQQDSVAGQKLLLNYSLYHFKFSCDSFFVSIKSYSKVNTGPDTCMRSGRWAEYCKGTYSQKQDTLHLKGQFCNADFTIKDDKGCFRSGDYEEIFKVSKKSEAIIRLESTSDVVPIDARLVKSYLVNPNRYSAIMNRLKALFLGVVISYLPVSSSAWATEGHRICGQIAERYLTPKTRKAIQLILGNETVAMAGNWADLIKSDPSYNYLSSWHYIDFDRAYTYPEMQAYLQHDRQVDAYTKLQFLVSELKKKDLSRENKLLYLRMLIHIIEDVHNPMHVSHADDRGGNDFKVYWFKEPTNLHAIWDYNLIDEQNLSCKKYAAAIDHTTAGQRAALQKAPVGRWLYESNQITAKLYTEIKPGAKLNANYENNHISVVNQQLLKAGIRLAGVLNQLFD